MCNGQSFNNNSNSTGNVVDLTASNQGCLSSGERQGTWYYFSPSAGGAIGFTISPSAPTDYDFALWGPMTSITCPPTGPPLRCSYSALYTNTGLGNSATDQTEGAGGDAWTSPITVSAGQVYILYIDNFSTNGQAFSLSWNLTNGASLDCTVLPIQLLDFSAVAVAEGVQLEWATATETNSDRFEVERSLDAQEFERVGTQPAAGNSAQEQHYEFLDRFPYPGINYYRLRSVDLDEGFEHSPVEAVTVDRPGQGEIIFQPNPGSDLVRVVLPEHTAGSTLVMSDGAGREVLRMRTESDRFVVNLSHLRQGLYQASLLSANGDMLARGSWVRE